MASKSVLIVDDEKNIRLTLSHTLEPLNLPARTAVNGEEALAMMGEEEFGLVLLDLKLPGMSGLEVMHRIRDRWPRVRVVIITAHGTIESAVEAMKMGAIDFVQKPFTPTEIREIVKGVLAREELDEESATDYKRLIELAKRRITDRQFDQADELVRKAIGLDPGQPEAYNLLGVLHEIRDQPQEAMKFYRAALDIDPTYKPAWTNLDRFGAHHEGRIDLGPEGGGQLFHAED